MSISVIIPTYNRKRLLQKTLNSILNQSRKADEIIVVDNESTDGTLEWLKTELKNEVIALSNDGQKSPGAARNLGMEAATGRYIKFFDSDDLMTSNTLEVQYSELSQSGKGFIYGPYFYATEKPDGTWMQNDPAILNYYPFDERKSLTQWMLLGLFITIPGMLFKRELLEETGKWRDDVIASEDWDYLFRLSLKESYPAHSNECAFLYRVHGEQTVGAHFNDYQRDIDKFNILIDIWEKYFGENSSYSWWEKQLFRNKFYQALKKYDHQEFQQFRKILKNYDVLMWQLFRFNQRIGRLRTKSLWQPYHGPLISPKQVDKYLYKISHG